MPPLNVRYYTNRANQKRKQLGTFLKQLKRKKKLPLAEIMLEVDAAVWKETNCLDCANCCKTMTPTWSKKEATIVAKSVGMSYKAYYDAYLMIDESNGDIVNQNTPCQHLNLDTNMCSVYELRPHDCRFFPHFIREDFLDQTDVYTNNLHRCVATLRMVEKLEAAVNAR